jgi:hypothetical protein
MKPKPTPSVVQKLNTAERIVGTLTTRSIKPRARKPSKHSKPFGKLETHQKAIRDLGDSIQAGEHKAFEAGWNAFLSNHSGLLISHGIKDFRIGFEEAWSKYWQSRKE